MVPSINKQNEHDHTVRRFAFLGGSFDPVHRAHLELMQAAYEQLETQRVFAVPAKQSPLKGHNPVASDEDRLAMLRLAIEGRPEFAIIDWEFNSHHPKSYTILTVEHLRKEFPDAQLWWIIGSDQFQQLSQWHQIERLVNLLNFVVYPRIGYPIESPSIPGLKWRPLTGPTFDLSSTEIRRLCQKGIFPEKALPPGVENYMKQHHLY